MMTKSLQYVVTKVRDLPTYDGLSEVDDFLNRFERELSKQQRLDTLRWVLNAMPARWWGTHQRSVRTGECKKMMPMWFGKPKTQLKDKYDGWDDPHAHLAKWTKVYGEEPQPEWVHLFCHTLDIIPMNWYIETKLHHGTKEWDTLHEGFPLTFMF